MYVQLNCALVDADVTNRQEMAGFLAQYGINLSAQMSSPEQLPQLLAGPEAPQLVIVNLDPSPLATLKQMAALPRQFTNASFFVMSQTIDPHLLMEAMHLGVKEFIPLPIPMEKMAAAIDRVASTFGMGKKAKIIHVVPTMGGCGSTTIACNLASALARAGQKTVLIDMDLIRGGVASYFDTRPRYTIADVMDSADKVDRVLLDNCLAVHKTSNVSLLPRPELPEDTKRLNQPGLHRLLHVLGRMFDYVVVDSIMSVDPLYTTVLQNADVNLLVMQLNVHSAKNAERFVGCLRRMGIEASKIRLVVNRFVKKGWDIEPDEVERALGLKIGWYIPNDFKNAIAAINYGEPVVLRAPRSEISTAMFGLSEVLLGKRAVAA